jgi:hypothetical protein
MPDGDVYDRKVDRGWQTAARRVFESDADELTLASLIRSLGRMMKGGGCPRIDEVVTITADALGSPEVSTTRREARTQLDRVRREACNDRTTVVVEAAKRLLADPYGLDLPDPNRRDPDAVHLKIAQWLMVELATRKFAPGALMQEQVENRGVPIEVFRRRRERARSVLASSPELARLTSQMLAHPNGMGIKAPRSKTPKPAQELLLNMAISS